MRSALKLHEQRLELFFNFLFKFFLQGFFEALIYRDRDTLLLNEPVRGESLAGAQLSESHDFQENLAVH